LTYVIKIFIIKKRKLIREEKIISKFKINWQIPFSKFLLIDEEGGKIGLVDKNYAISIAQERGLDVALIAPQAQPPVAKLLDYGKYKYEQEKLAKKQKAKSKIIDIKEIRLSLQIGSHDLEVKAKLAQGFLEKKNKVKINLRLVGREMKFAQKGRELVENFAQKLNQVGDLEAGPYQEGNIILALIIPKVQK
jgi:translation initiation factor IF-3